MKKLNIAITISLKEKSNIWNNGIAQNVVNFALLLKNSPKDYNVFIVNTSDSNDKLEYDIEGINIHQIGDVIKDIDLLFILGSQILDEHYVILKHKGVKMIYYNCGSNYVLDMQQSLYFPETTKKIYGHIPDEIWIIPQNYKLNKYYHETIYKKEAKKVPFVWSSVFIDYTVNNFNLKPEYTPSDKPKRIACFEPNIDVVKYAMYDILIVEQAYNENPELIQHFYVTNAYKLKDNPLFINIMNKMDIVRDKKATFEGRFNMPYFLQNYTDIVVAHQWENPLNYAYLDALYLKYPLIHNARLMKDGGYYYDEFDVKKGKEQLLYALTEHDKNMDEYNERNKKILYEFSTTNEESINKYDKMIEELLKK